MEMIKLDITKAACFLKEGAVESFEPKVAEAQKALEAGTCPGNDFLDGCTCPAASHLLSSTNCRLVPTPCALTARLS